MLPPIAPTTIDFAGLEQLRSDAARNKPEALAEAAVQFEALMIGMLLKSARKASLGEGIFDSSQTRQYLELMDDQVALEMARRGGFGFGATIREQLGQRGEVRDATSKTPVDSEPPRTPREFVASILPAARAAARRLGVDPRVLVAQAALETGWGESIPNHVDGRPANNLFGIKAGPTWRGARVAHATLENVDGAIQRQRLEFRAYGSVAESFEDYAQLISESPRYAQALSRASDAKSYVNEVANAGYATDPDYAEKWLAVYSGAQMDSALSDLKESGYAPTY
jgi:flagellar protein FlgJ